MDVRVWYWNTISELESLPWMFSMIEDFRILKIPCWSHAFHLQYQWFFSEMVVMANKSNTDDMKSEHSLFTLHTSALSFGLYYYTFSSTIPAPIRLIWVGTSWNLILNIVCVLLLRISWLWGRRFCPKSQVFWNLKGPSPFVAVSLVIFHICRVFGWRMQMGACCSWATTKKTLILELMM